LVVVVMFEAGHRKFPPSFHENFPHLTTLLGFPTASTVGVRGARKLVPEKAPSYFASLSTPWLFDFKAELFL